MAAENKLINDFKEQSVYRISLNYPRIEKCLTMLTEEEVWHKPNSSSNSIGNLILHLSGNITQYILSALGGEADNRVRDLEFSSSGVLDKAGLLDRIKDVSEKAMSIISSISEEHLLKNYEVQGYTLTGTAIIIHVTEHYSYHTGQITLLTKLFKDTDTGYYKNMDLNKKNRS